MAKTPAQCRYASRSDRFQISASAFDAKSETSSAETRIVAIGSSSTAGEGDLVPYPGAAGVCCCESKYRDSMIDVLNRGLGGQEAPSTNSSALSPTSSSEAPALVVWQVGTNAIFRNESFDLRRGRGIDRDGSRVARGLADGCGADGPAIRAGHGRSRRSAGLSSEHGRRGSPAAAEKAGVNVFRRFDLMRALGNQDEYPDRRIGPMTADELSS